MRTTRRGFMGGAAALAAGAALPVRGFAQTGGTLRVGLSNPVIPRTTGNALMGIEGRRFIDHTIYDPLFYYGVQQDGDPNALQGYLATSFTSDESNRRVWRLELREGVTFHDGSAFDADSMIWNMGKYFDPNAPHYMPEEAANVQSFAPKLSGWEKTGPRSFAIETAEPDPFARYALGQLTIASPARFAEVGSWEAFALNPSGTGPFRLAFVDFSQRAELVRNDGYWNANRVPRVERMVYTPLFEPNTRTTALVTGQVDWIEAVAPDTVDLLTARGGKLVTNPYPQVWGYMLNCREGSPFADIRVRKAANLAVDRQGMVAILNGLMIPSTSHYPEGHPWHGNPSFKSGYDPEQARALLAEAGYGPENPIRVKALATTGGSGMMQPPIMNAFVQANLREVGIEMEIDAVDWNGLWGALSLGADAPESRGCDMFNFSLATHDPSEPLREWGSRYFPPNGLNWGYAKSDKVDAIVDRLLQTFDPAEQTALLAAFNAAIVDEAFSLYVAFDAFPRAFAANVSGYAEGYNGIKVQDPSFITIS